MQFHVTSAAALAAVLLAHAAVATAVAQESATFSVDRTEVTAASQASDSTSFAATLVLGQMSPAGAASRCNAGFVASLGFFSMFGDLQVPIELRLEKVPGEPLTVDLTWTGAADRFGIYRSSSPQNVLAAENLQAEAVLCGGSNTAGSDSLLFYQVVAAP